MFHRIIALLLLCFIQQFIGEVVRVPDVDPRYGIRQKELRLARGLSIRALADKAGADYTYLARIEQGVYAPPSEQVIVRIARVVTSAAQSSEAIEQELLALARKPHPEAVEAVTDIPPEGLDFLRTVRERPPSPETWKRLRAIVSESPANETNRKDRDDDPGHAHP